MGLLGLLRLLGCCWLLLVAAAGLLGWLDGLA